MANSGHNLTDVIEEALQFAKKNGFKPEAKPLVSDNLAKLKKQRLLRKRKILAGLQ